MDLPGVVDTRGVQGLALGAAGIPLYGAGGYRTRLTGLIVDEALAAFLVAPPNAAELASAGALANARSNCGPHFRLREHTERIQPGPS
ncbi:hypothetical protein ACIRUL_17805 [Streptomyces sp. NPDC101171]|uniref:hypothetical protein n=1 Tax=Streptomyces sp. NPDC101171 TaxID=3366122 RepID=UPI003803F023